VRAVFALFQSIQLGPGGGGFDILLMHFFTVSSHGDCWVVWVAQRRQLRVNSVANEDSLECLYNGTLFFRIQLNPPVVEYHTVVQIKGKVEIQKGQVL